jgi:hypothetical protein
VFVLLALTWGDCTGAIDATGLVDVSSAVGCGAKCEHAAVIASKNVIPELMSRRFMFRPSIKLLSI